MIPPLTMRQTAEALGLSYDRFRKIWPDLCQRSDLPAPLLGRRWDGAAVEAWKAARSSRRFVAPLPAAAPIAPNPARAAAHARARLEDLRRA